MAIIRASNQITVNDLTDAYSVTLSSDSATFQQSSSAQTYTIKVTAMCGSDAVACTLGTLSVSGSSATATNSGVSNNLYPVVTVTIAKNATTGGTITIPVNIVVGSNTITVTKVFTYSIALASQTVESSTTEYYLSDSDEEQTGGSWVTDIPKWVSGKYLWVRTKIVYKNPSLTTYAGLYCDSSWTAADDAADTAVSSTDQNLMVLKEEIIDYIDRQDGSISSVMEKKYVTDDTMQELVGAIQTQITQMPDQIQYKISQQVNKSMQGLSDQLAELQNNVSTWFSFATDGFYISKNNSDFKTQISEKEFAVYDGSTKVAYFGNKQLNIANATVEKRLAIGNFAFVVNSDDSISLKRVK
jgi:hypothetical protein